jgi:hypothetical protein
MNFVRNFVSVIPRVNFQRISIMDYSTLILNREKEINKNNNQKNKLDKKEKINKDKNNEINEINEIDKLDNEYLTKKSIEHAYNY